MIGNGCMIGGDAAAGKGVQLIGRVPIIGERYTVTVIGVQDTGARSSNGATLKQVRYNGSGIVETTLETAYFDAHPLYQFPDWTDAASNVFCTIPIAYWWRGNLPDVADGTTPRWTMLLSTRPGTVNINGTSCTFTANPGAFKLSGSWLPQFYYGKYRGYNAGSSKVGSKSGQTIWGGVSFDNFRTYCANNGTGYHMGSLFEWHEILARMVIEKNTLQLMPSRSVLANCTYRGVEYFAYGPTSGVYNEYADGVRTGATGQYELWAEAGGPYESTATTAPSDTAGDYTQAIVSGELFDHQFMASSLGAASTSFIPVLFGRVGSLVNCICRLNFYASNVFSSALSAMFDKTTAYAHASISTRLSKW